MADRIAVLHEGRLEQIGSPHELYRAPATHFVAAFLGEANFVPGRVAAPGRVETALGVFALDTGAREAGTPVELMLRPELIEFAGRDSAPLAGENEWEGRIADESYLGEFSGWQLECAGSLRMTVNERAPERRNAGELCKLRIRSDRVVMW